LWLGLAGTAPAVPLCCALLLSSSRVPFVIADDGPLPAPLARTDANGTPRNAVLVSALIYSAFVLIPFDSLVFADVLLYSLALSLEFASLVALRRREPELRGAFRIPLGTRPVTILAAVPMLVLVIVIYLSFRDGEYGLPALGGAMVAIVLGPLFYAVPLLLKISPPFITNCTLRAAEISRVGSPCTAIKSANSPGFTAPMRLSQCNIFAFTDVAARSAWTGVIP